MLTRRTARKSYRQFISELADFTPARHHDFLIEKLQAVADGHIKRLMVFMPLGPAKSTYANFWLASCWMGRNPEGTIFTAPYCQEIADNWGPRSMAIASIP